MHVWWGAQFIHFRVGGFKIYDYIQQEGGM